MDMSMVGNGLGSFVSGYITQTYNNKIANINADTENKVRAMNNVTTAKVNERDAVLTATQRWAQETRNSRVYENLGKNQEALAVNFNRARDVRSRSNFADNVRFAEEDGRQQAAAAASGVTGSVVDVISMTSRLRRNMEESVRIDNEALIGSDYKRTEFDQRWASLDNLDYTTIFDNENLMDFGRSVAKTQSAISAGLANNGAIKTMAQGFFKFNTPDNGLGGKASAGTQGMGD